MATRVNARFMDGRDNEFQTRPQLINESVSKLNDALSEGRYFYVEILAQGIMLYDSGEYRLATPRELDYAEIKEMAEAYYKDKYSDAEDFLFHAKIAQERGTYQMCSFMLHQATENFIKTIPLVYVLYGYKEHDLEFLIEKCKPYTLDLAKVFPRDTDEEERLFKLLQRAYIEARYNKRTSPSPRPTSTSSSPGSNYCATSWKRFAANGLTNIRGWRKNNSAAVKASVSLFGGLRCCKECDDP